MIVIGRNCNSSLEDDLSSHSYIFGNFTIKFTEDEYNYLSDLLTDTKERPEFILKAIIEEGLYSFMDGE